METNVTPAPNLDFEQVIANAHAASLPPVVALDSPAPITQVMNKRAEFPAWLLNTGFLVALILAGACLLAAGYYLYQFQGLTQDAVTRVLTGHRVEETNLYQVAMGAQLYLARIQLLSCGIFIGMSFGFLGFALFLLGIQGQMNAEGSATALTIKILNLSPGVFVLLCATILIGVCATKTLPLSYDFGNGNTYSIPKSSEESSIPIPNGSLE